MTDTKISVIIPVYNVEKYIHQCLDSILSQSLREIEVICINDDSPDKCPQILDDYAQKDERVIVIHKKNEGQGAARNEGLKIAKGEYVIFVDSDDWLETDALSKLYSKIKADDSDVLFFNVIRQFESNGESNFYRFIEPYYIKFRDKSFHPLEAKDVLYQTTAHPFKIYKRDSLTKYNYQYSVHRHWEDHLPYFCFLANCEKISVLNEFIYNYRVRQCSSTYTADRCMDDIFDSFYECEAALKNTKYGNELISQYLVHRLQTFFFYLYLMPFMKKFRYYRKLQKTFKYITETYDKRFYAESIHADRIDQAIKYPYLVYLLFCKIKSTIIAIKSHI